MQCKLVSRYAKRAGCLLGLALFLALTSWAQTENVLHSFTGADSEYPNGSLIFDAAGNLYGTTQAGGTCSSSTSGCGVVFELSPSASGGWTEKVLHSFGGAYGVTPSAGVVLDSKGNLYGTTYGGGAYNAGVVFELILGTNGWKEQVLYSFTGSTDGGIPVYDLVLDRVGNLYGTTFAGGANGQGVAFELTQVAGSGWTESVLLSFNNLEGLVRLHSCSMQTEIFTAQRNLAITTTTIKEAHCLSCYQVVEDGALRFFTPSGVPRPQVSHPLGVLC